MILNATNISKSFGSNEIIKDATFLVNEHEKVAIVGVNGAGKTTLLKVRSMPTAVMLYLQRMQNSDIYDRSIMLTLRSALLMNYIQL